MHSVPSSLDKHKPQRPDLTALCSSRPDRRDASRSAAITFCCDILTVANKLVMAVCNNKRPLKKESHNEELRKRTQPDECTQKFVLATNKVE